MHRATQSTQQHDDIGNARDKTSYSSSINVDTTTITSTDVLSYLEGALNSLQTGLAAAERDHSVVAVQRTVNAALQVRSEVL